MTLTSAPPATSTTQAVVNHHLERFAALDLQGILADYAPDAVMIVPTGVLRGVREISPLFENLVAEFAKPGATFDLQQQVIEGEVAYIRWSAETSDNTYQLGTDTFLVRHGKITVQTFAFKAAPKA
jgi:ketosteroid isomerase-like protein